MEESQHQREEGELKAEFSQAQQRSSGLRLKLQGALKDAQAPGPCANGWELRAGSWTLGPYVRWSPWLLERCLEDAGEGWGAVDMGGSGLGSFLVPSLNSSRLVAILDISVG